MKKRRELLQYKDQILLKNGVHKTNKNQTWYLVTILQKYYGFVANVTKRILLVFLIEHNMAQAVQNVLCIKQMKEIV